jgi:sec-independent protein translocase protein TatB
MFDIGFSEMMVIAVVALIVIGPERLPKVARTLGHLFGRMQRYVNDVKADISREMELDELRKLQTTIQSAAQSFETSVKSEVSATEAQFQQLAQDLNPVASDPVASDPVTPAPVAESAATLPMAEPLPTLPLVPEPPATLPLVPELPAAAPRAADPPAELAPGQLTPAESKAQLSLDLVTAPVTADKPA